MTIRQRVLKAVYPAFTWFGKLTGKNAKNFANDSASAPLQSIYDLSVILNNGDSISLSKFKGKKKMIRYACHCINALFWIPLAYWFL